jgi:alkanesulfonate monooxygenase SsuD/methylene tetrahydromethanopterin reductase-like flavin-dependent oxidoreductase (luciferase family)
MTFSAAVVLCCGSTEAEVERRAAAIGREPAELRVNGVAGTPTEVAAGIRSWRDVGAERVYLQVLDLADLDHLDLVANEVAPLLD